MAKISLTSRAAARKRGELFYETGEPCGRNHMSERRVSDGRCISCIWEDLERQGKQMETQKNVL